MKKLRIIAMFLALAMTLSVFTMTSFATQTEGDTEEMPFTDVDADSWYYTYVKYVYGHNLFKGTSEDKFSPDMEMTRAMFVQLFANLDGADLSQYTETKFADVDMKEWYGPAVAWAEANSVVNGTSETTFSPADEITREQMCVLLVNYAKYADIDLTVEDPKETNFPDAEKISSWAKEAVEICAAAGIINGKGDGSVDPQGTASRAEVATLITNFHTKFFSEDELDMWFDHTTVKVARSDTTSSGKTTYTMYMAKNEIEACQVFLATEADRSGLTIEVTPFKNGSGAELTTEIFEEYYTKMDNGIYRPDALPPVQGEFSIKANQSKGFLIKAKTTADTAEGEYTAQVIVKEGGNVVKQADVKVNVWNFTLSDETACATAFGLGRYDIYVDHMQYESDDSVLYKAYYDYLLENRISAYYLPYDLTDPRADEYMSDPRVTSFCITGYHDNKNDDEIREIYSKLSQNEEWLDKAYFYYVDEPMESGKLNDLKNAGERLEKLYPGYNMIAPYFTNIDISADLDQIGFMSDYLTIWCAKVFAHTLPEDKDIQGVQKAQYLMTDEQVAKYGTFEERMAAEVAGGDKLWWYHCWEPVDPYANFDASRQGLNHRVTFWHQQMYDITGCLYFNVNCWYEGGMDQWRNLKQVNAGGNDVYGDGILIYSGEKYGIRGPIGSLRLEDIRDGIEDYQYLEMAKTLLGQDRVDEIISQVTTGVLHYIDDDDVFAQIRIELGNALEAASK